MNRDLSRGDSSRSANLSCSLPVVLIIDSDPVCQVTAKTILNYDEYSVHAAGDRASAISMAGRLPLDLIICELNVDGENGIDIARQIRSLPDRSDVPVMFASSGQVPDVIRRKHEFGGAYHLKKPFDPKVLIELVERALWMPHLVQTHISRPHFEISPPAPTT